MGTVPLTIDRIWLNHPTLGPIQAEGRADQRYAPSAVRQIWRWFRPHGDGTLETFLGWQPFEVSVEPVGSIWEPAAVS